ncbi:HNH endonuclease [Streptomyces sp. NPDC055287]
MTAADNATVTALNTRGQTWRITAGDDDTTSVVKLRTGQRAHVGDILVTRQNRRRMTERAGRDFVKNGDTWAVAHILPNGEAVARHTQHRPDQLPDDYLAAQCVVCGSTSELQFDHVIPVAMGGGSGPQNLQLLCGSCNRREGAGLAGLAPAGTRACLTRHDQLPLEAMM